MRACQGRTSVDHIGKLLMSKGQPRKFECPESGQSCTDPRCTRDLCCENERLEAAAKRETAARASRVELARNWEIIGPILKQWQRKNSN